jgi:hypothetical protein
MNPIGTDVTALLLILAFFLALVAALAVGGVVPGKVPWLVAAAVVGFFVLAWNAAAVAW